MSSPPTQIHDKIPLITSFLLPLLTTHKTKFATTTTKPPTPFFLGISGPQGSGKTSLSAHLSHHLTTTHNLTVLTLSIDDLYLPYSTLTALSAQNPTNPFLRNRGNPGTHDIPLGAQLFENIDGVSSRVGFGEGSDGDIVHIPSYDKSRHGGKGDRVDPGLWKSERPPWDVVVFEGWCVGFTPLSEEEVEEKWRVSRDSGTGTVGRCELKDLLWLNEMLKGYVALWERFDAFLQLDAEDISYVYDWRKQQEHGLIAEKGMGMTDEQVTAFVDSYMPAYELYLDGLREGLFKNDKTVSNEGRARKHLKIVIGKDRNAVEIVTL
ncbi:P-loop containing nucleoside triphosphate hydrolase protein [Peziza echinospora]|nr:P-loop containing nucleoside triphosphate hydrolase protein [Peziza echinospora]